MKKISVLLAVLLTLCMVLPASAKMSLGVLGGLNLANLSFDPKLEGFDLSNHTVFGIGGVLDYNLNESFSFHLEPMYLLKGCEGEAEGFDVKMEADLAYLEVPVMLKYSFVAKDIKPYIMAGPTIGFNLSAKRKITVNGDSEEEDVKDDVKSIDFGLGFGAGVSLPMDHYSIFVEARYTLGLTNINDDPEDSDTDVKTKGIQIFAGVTFPLGGK